MRIQAELIMILMWLVLETEGRKDIFMFCGNEIDLIFINRNDMQSTVKIYMQKRFIEKHMYTFFRCLCTIFFK